MRICPETKEPVLYLDCNECEDKGKCRNGENISTDEESSEEISDDVIFDVYTKCRLKHQEKDLSTMHLSRACGKDKRKRKNYKKTKQYKDAMEQILEENKKYQNFKNEPQKYLWSDFIVEKELYKEAIEGMADLNNINEILDKVDKIKARKKREEEERQRVKKELEYKRLVEEAVNEMQKIDFPPFYQRWEDEIVDRVIKELDTHYAKDRFQCGYSDLSIDNIEKFIEKEIEGDWPAEPNIWEQIYWKADKISYRIFFEKIINLQKYDDLDLYDEWFWKFTDSGGDYQKIIDKVTNIYDEERLIEKLKENIYYKKVIVQYEIQLMQNKMLQADILSAIPERYEDLFPAARLIKRKFYIHIGSTNSGKTHGAIERMKEIGEGVYLAPLRLLAYEIFERLNSEGLICSMRTGEEEFIFPDASFVAETIEMCDYNRPYPCAVIDEAQMIADRDRGGAWTSAILGLCAEEIHVCASPDAKDAIIHLINLTNDKYEVIEHERKTKLVIEDNTISFPDDVLPGDALIVFSRKDAHAVAATLKEKKINCSIIYGALPYDVRHEEAKKFASGENKVVVATDAIGMGMNLPIKRVVFLKQAKFDGYEPRALKPSEALQIAGRAGRYGLYDTGYVTAIDGDIKSLLNSPVEDIKEAVISFPPALIDIDAKLSSIIAQWGNIAIQEGFKRTTTDTLLRLATYLENYSDDKHMIYRLITIPFDERNPDLLQVWQGYSKKILKGAEVDLYIDSLHTLMESNLQQLEYKYHKADLLYNFAKITGKESEAKEITEIKKAISNDIFTMLSRGKYNKRVCKNCGRTLKWDYPYGICEKCHW